MIDIKIINGNFDIKKYNKKAAHPLQSWEWGEARRKTGIEVLRVGEFNVGNRHACSLQNIFQLSFHKIPFTNYKIGYLPRSVFPSKEVLEFLKQEGKERKCIFIKIEPYVKKSEIRNPKSETNSKFQILNSKLQIIKSSHPLFPNWTIMMDLTRSEEELLKNMKPKTRYNIHLAEKRGVTVCEMTNNQGFEIFSKLYFKTCKRQKYFGHDYHYHRLVFETLKDKIAHILVAFYKNTPLSAYEIFIFNDVLYYPYGGSSLEYRNFMGANLLMWEAVKFGKKMGAKLFDMWGSLPPNYSQNDPWAGFTRFKEGYGGKFVELVGSYDLVINKSLYSLYNLIYKLRGLFLTLKQNF
jgi:lipid II:glycine glycyltransferase (peptidoglycan interpeptide bridge formation enzyme)